MDKFKKIFSNKRILVTGGTGSIGSEIVRQLLKFSPKQIRIYSRDEFKQFRLQQELENHKENKKKILRFLIGDIRDKDRLDRAFREIDVVFHAAALKHVPFCETNPFEAAKTNITGTQNVVDLAIDHKIEKMVAISTDKAVNPNTVMGITKLMMERLVVSAPNYSGNPKIKFAVVRFGNVINSRGSVIPKWMEQIEKGHPVTITDKKMERYFMSIQDAVNLVFLAVSRMLGSEVFVLKMPKYNIYDLAKEVMSRYSNGIKPKIKITGARDREKITEKLYTEEEQKLMIDAGLFNIILPDEKVYKQRLTKYKLKSKLKTTELKDVLDSLVNTTVSI